MELVRIDVSFVWSPPISVLTTPSSSVSMIGPRLFQMIQLSTFTETKRSEIIWESHWKDYNDMTLYQIQVVLLLCRIDIRCLVLQSPVKRERVAKEIYSWISRWISLNIYCSSTVFYLLVPIFIFQIFFCYICDLYFVSIL